MSELLQLVTLHLFLLASTTAKEPELPLCPTNIPYFPQNLPMHCRMPVNPNPSNSNDAMTIPPGYLQNPPFDKRLPPVQPGMPGYQGMPGMPIPGMPMPGMSMPGMPMPESMSAPIAGPPQMPGQKLPVIVMPLYRPDNSDKTRQPPWRPKRRPYDSHETDSSSDTDSDTVRGSDTDSSSDGVGFWRPRNTRRSASAFRQRKRRRQHRRKKNRKHLLTPVLQYVTKDGYVIFEKQITKDEANDWLKLSKNIATGANDGGESTKQKVENIQIDEEDDAGLEKKREKVKAKRKNVVVRQKARRVNKIAKLVAHDSEDKEKKSEAQ